MAFGEEAEADQILQILNSDDIKQHIIEKFDLYTHYDINQGSKYRYTELSDRYDDNIDFYRTKYLAVKIEVLDKDPIYASNIANEIALMLDSIKNKMQKKVALQAYKIVKKEFDLLKNQISNMEDTLNMIRKKGVQDYETQVEVLTEQYGAALVSNNQSAALEQYQNGNWQIFTAAVPASATVYDLHALTFSGNNQLSKLIGAGNATANLSQNSSLITTEDLKVFSGSSLIIEGELTNTGILEVQDRATLKINYAFANPAAQLFAGTEERFGKRFVTLQRPCKAT